VESDRQKQKWNINSILKEKKFTNIKAVVQISKGEQRAVGSDIG
jgi:hypothetical protein